LGSRVSSTQEIARRLPIAFSILGSTHRGKGGIAIENEYDVQHVLHAVAVLHFDEVEPEEPTPKMASASSRLDFLLREEEIAIETKMMRPSLSKQKGGNHGDISHATWCGSVPALAHGSPRGVW
jgi:hypothetical protein